MSELHEALAGRVDAWRASGYPHERYPAIAEILAFAIEGPEDTPQLRYLRAAQLRALETYWYLRLVEATPTIPELYRRLFERTTERLTALGLGHAELRDLATDFGYEGLIDRLLVDDALAKRHRLDALSRDPDPRLPQLDPRPRDGRRQDRPRRHDRGDRVRDGARIPGRR